VRNLTKFLLDASAKIIELNEEICKCKENYEVLRLGILRSAENQIAEKMTKRYQKMRLDFLKDISRIIQEKASD
jgi:ribosome maturation factor RimP